MLPKPLCLFSLTSSVLLSTLAHAHDSIEQITVSGRAVNLIGQSQSASEGLVSQKDIEVRALLRTGEILELIPGMVVTQHSGTGKANQYFLRGFNLDHGTDFATSYDAMPVNMRSHGHGQGYTDLNFIIPELVGAMHYHKGPYYADVGDFSGAGAAQIISRNRLDAGMVKLTGGENGYGRLLVGDTFAGPRTDITAALEATYYDGPWTDIDEDLEKFNGLLKGVSELGGGTFAWSLMGYRNEWNSADQIPARAVNDGVIDRLGSIDTSTGGESSRYSVNLGWQGERWKASAYILEYDLNLWSNFTYYLDNPDTGDQFEQVDDRRIYGGEMSYTREGQLGAIKVSNTFGLQTRVDDINEVGLYATSERLRQGVVRADAITEASVAAYWSGVFELMPRLRSELGVRYDFYAFDVKDSVGVNSAGVDLGVNSGRTHEGMASLKASLIYTLSEAWETYLSAGTGFHSNDARGTTIVVDPADGSAAEPVDPLVRSRGAEWGVRAYLGERLNLSAALWYLELDSELLFVGDAGNTETSDATERTGLELAAYYALSDYWTLDLEYAYTDARFQRKQPGRDIPGAVEDVLQLGLSADLANGLFGSLRLRYFGPRPLVETGEIRSDSSTLVNLKTGYRFDQFILSLDLLNLLDSDDHDIDYFYESQLATETAPVEDLHYHPLEPRTARVTLEYRF